jgi:hypothetical protein
MQLIESQNDLIKAKEANIIVMEEKSTGTEEPVHEEKIEIILEAEAGPKVFPAPVKRGPLITVNGD